MDVEFQGMVELVVDVDGAIDCLLDAKEKLERSFGFEAGREWYVRQMTAGIGDVLALTGYSSVCLYCWYDEMRSNLTQCGSGSSLEADRRPCIDSVGRGAALAMLLLHRAQIVSMLSAGIRDVASVLLAQMRPFKSPHSIRGHAQE